jgi:hypothetical protein
MKKTNSTEADFRHLLQLTKALRLAVKGDLVKGIKPDPEDAGRLWAALDIFLAQHEREKFT